MSEFAVYRTLGNGRCLVLDDTRIAGGKPDYRGNNYITSWVTNETYGPVDELKSENAKLRELVRGYDSALHRMCSQAQSYTNCHCSDCVLAKGYEDADTCSIDDIRREASRLGIEVER